MGLGNQFDEILVRIGSLNVAISQNQFCFNTAFFQLVIDPKNGSWKFADLRNCFKIKGWRIKMKELRVT